jgi:TPR repeat protein
MPTVLSQTNASHVSLQQAKSRVFGPSVSPERCHDNGPRRARSLSIVMEGGRASPSSQSSSLYSSETIDNRRKAVKASNDPVALFHFALSLLALSKAIDTGEEVSEEHLHASVHSVGPYAASPTSSRSFGREASNCSSSKKKKKKYLSPSDALVAEAMKYIKKLAYSSVGLGKAPLPEAQHFLGEALSEGHYSCSIDHERAFHLYWQASKQNHPESTYKAAFAYENGTGTKRDATRAVQFYRKAASLGDPYAMHRLALVLQHGQLGQTKNPREAMTWLKRAAHIAAESHYPRPLHDLAQCYEKNGGSSAVIPDEAYAFDLYTKAAMLGFAPSQHRLGLCYEHGHLNCPKNAEASIAWYAKAAEQEHAEAQLALSGWYLTGAPGILRHNETEAFLWAQKAAEKGLAKAQYALGHYYETGTGTPVSMFEAFQWYKKAALQDNKRALKRLKELKKLIKSGKLPCPAGLKIDTSPCSIM